MVRTVVKPDGGLKVPVFLASENEGLGCFASEALEMNNSVLEKMIPAKDLTSLIVVKLNKDDNDVERLAPRVFPDGETRELVFSSGKNYYFGNATLLEYFHKLTEDQQGAIFESQRDGACRYGGLLVSDCFNGIDVKDNLRIKIVDFEDPQFAEFKTGDCHGKISPSLALEMGCDRNRAFQFRLAWMQNWESGAEAEPQHSFLAKGTFQPDTRLTEAQGYDIILDRSSIKGVNKDKLAEWFPCGDYELPQAILGNRSNSKVTTYDSSWQFNVWFSEDAIRQDLGPITEAKAEALASVQRDPLTLARHIVEKHDEDLAQRQKQTDDEEFDALFDVLSALEGETTRSEDNEKNEQRLVKILRADKNGELLTHPKIVTGMREFLAGQWKELSIKSGFQHSSGMALPNADLPRGTVCIPHLPEGDVVVTRYPIVSRDNIRVYENVRHPKLCRSKGVFWFNPEDAEQYHQGDFDGDQIVCSPADKIPTIAKEALRAGEDGEFIPVVQRKKVAYTDDLPLYQVAYNACQNDVGRVAINIGRVKSAEFDQEAIPKASLAAKQILGAAQTLKLYTPEDQETYRFKVNDWQLNIDKENTVYVRNSQDQLIFRGGLNEGNGTFFKNGLDTFKENAGVREELFGLYKRNLLDRLMIGLQVEVDYQKNSERLTDIESVTLPNGREINIAGDTLLKECKDFRELYPSHFFDFMKDEDRRLYRTYPLPAEQTGSLNVLPREIVNPLWEATQIPAIERHHFKYLFPEDFDTLLDSLNLEGEARRDALDAIVKADEWVGKPNKFVRNNDGTSSIQIVDPQSLKNRFDRAMAEIDPDLNRKETNESIGKIYEVFRSELNELFPSDEEKMIAAAAVWRSQHTQPESWRTQTKCLEIAKKIPVTFEERPNYTLPSEALPRNTFVLSVPFGEKDGDLVLPWEMALTDDGITFDIVMNKALPTVEFALKNIPEAKLESLKAHFKDSPTLSQVIEDLEIPSDLRIIPPEHYGNLIEPSEKAGTAALVFNLFADQIAQRLEEKKIEPLTIIGINRNELKGQDFTTEAWTAQPLSCGIGKIELDKAHSDYRRYNGAPVVEINGQRLGIFAEESPKLCIGTTFDAVLRVKSKSAVFLDVIPTSIKPPELNQAEATSTQETSIAEQDFTDQLMNKLKQTYERSPAQEAPLTLVWGDLKACISPDGETTLRRNRQPIFKGNVLTNDVHQELSNESKSYVATMVKSEPQSPSAKTNNRQLEAKQTTNTITSGFSLD
ncbi:hypothetical protein ACQ4M3_20510 [Leptolyngbya sp. AN03gr2]|uniref:hypothetical protein n=1 Tax=unclassified Leptolyngbya TaxID=2650499 RepID=UPI003D318ED3